MKSLPKEMLEQINAVIKTTMVKVRTLLEKLTGSDD